MSFPSQSMTDDISNMIVTETNSLSVYSINNSNSTTNSSDVTNATLAELPSTSFQSTEGSAFQPYKKPSNQEVICETTTRILEDPGLLNAAEVPIALVAEKVPGCEANEVPSRGRFFLIITLLVLVLATTENISHHPWVYVRPFEVFSGEKEVLLQNYLDSAKRAREAFEIKIGSTSGDTGK